MPNKLPETTITEAIYSNFLLSHPGKSLLQAVLDTNRLDILVFALDKKKPGKNYISVKTIIDNLDKSFTHVISQNVMVGQFMVNNPYGWQFCPNNQYRNQALKRLSYAKLPDLISILYNQEEDRLLVEQFLLKHWHNIIVDPTCFKLILDKLSSLDEKSGRKIFSKIVENKAGFNVIFHFYTLQTVEFQEKYKNIFPISCLPKIEARKDGSAEKTIDFLYIPKLSNTREKILQLYSLYCSNDHNYPLTQNLASSWLKDIQKDVGWITSLLDIEGWNNIALKMISAQKKGTERVKFIEEMCKYINDYSSKEHQSIMGKLLKNQYPEFYKPQFGVL